VGETWRVNRSKVQKSSEMQEEINYLQQRVDDLETQKILYGIEIEQIRIELQNIMRVVESVGRDGGHWTK
jgi:TolA-binding protein